MALKITRLRVTFFNAMKDGSSLTFQQILGACGVGSHATRGDYIRIHQFVMGFVKQGILIQNKVPRHGKSTFSLSPVGKKTAGALLDSFETKVRQMLQWSPPLAKRLISQPWETRNKAEPQFRCPNCGMATSVTEAQAMIRAGQKVRCHCNYNLTALAWAAMEGR